VDKEAINAIEKFRTLPLLKAAISYLEDELMPSLTGYHCFKIRAARKVLSTIRSDLELR